MIKDSIVNLKKSLRTTLQNVPAVVDTLIRGLDEVEDAADTQTTYSETERVVGKWIDGSDLYEKVIKFGALPDTTSKSVPHGITGIKTIVSIMGTSADEGYTSTITIPDHSPAVSIFVSNINVVITTLTDRSSNVNTFITLRYTKTAANRAPENDTKNGGDEPAEDPDVKTVENPVEPAEELKK